uniref:THAP-type domain-containing protein n=3 Tax=Nothobranchius pienaari TaxID=704102 RepID=A0A1A8LX43_9TELE
MVHSCCVNGCRARSHNYKRQKLDNNIRFFKFPSWKRGFGNKIGELTKRRRMAWVAAVGRKDITFKTAPSHMRVCSLHFHKGQPAYEMMETDPDWAPSLHMGHNSVRPTDTSRAARRMARLQLRQETSGWPSKAKDVKSEDWAPTLNLCYLKCNEGPQTEACKQPCTEEVADFNDVLSDGGSPIPYVELVEDECQTDLTMVDLTRLEDAVKDYTSDICGLREKLQNTKFTQETFQDNEKTKFYTGLPNFLVLMQIFQLCEQFITVSSISALSKFEQFIMVLMHLRLNLQFQDLAYRFNVSTSTVSRIWLKMIPVLHERLKFLIEWPEREVTLSTMPMSFRKAFGSKVAVILDCFEVFIERPYNFLAREQTWSKYNRHNTIKFLTGISPQGYVTYISSAWGGRTSDKQITEECGILNKLLPGDIVLADRGFTAEDCVEFFCASLKTPAFTKGKKQLSAYEVEQTRKLAGIRFHVERVIGLVRRKYQILQSRTMPIGHVAVKSTDSLALADKIAVICCALFNLSESVVPLESC